MSELQSSVVGGQSGACQHQQLHTALQRGPNILVNRDWTQETGAQQSSPNILPGNTTFNNIISLYKTVSSSKLVIHMVYTSKAPKHVLHTHAYRTCAQICNFYILRAQVCIPPKHNLNAKAKEEFGTHPIFMVHFNYNFNWMGSSPEMFTD